MAQKPDTSSFKYVTVEPDDAELVIMAGSREADLETPPGEQKAAAPVGGAVGADLPAEAGGAPSAKKPAATAQGMPAGKPAEAADGAYRETTLEDLDREPMSKMQRAVLIGIAVLVVAFVAYVLFF